MPGSAKGWGSTRFGASEGKEGKEPWDEAWRVKDATTPHLLRNIPARCELDGPYARRCALAVEVEAAGFISWSLTCQENCRDLVAFWCFSSSTMRNSDHFFLCAMNTPHGVQCLGAEGRAVCAHLIGKQRTVYYLVDIPQQRRKHRCCRGRGVEGRGYMSGGKGVAVEG